MNVQFHPPKDQEHYAEQALKLLLQAAIPRFKEQQLQNEQAPAESRSA